MSREFSKAAQNYPPSGIRKMFDLATQYPDAIKLTVGEPNFDTPAYIKEAAKKAMDAGETHYTPNAGMPVLRRAVAERYQKSHWDGYTADHVMVTVGAMEGLMLTMMLLLDPGDEILVPDPCFPNYYGQASLTGACAKPVPTYEDNDYRMMAADIEKCITPHTKALLLNSPCNPTGAVLTKEDILAIAEVVKKHDLWVLSDEPYDSIVYNSVTPFSIAQVPEVRDRVFVCHDRLACGLCHRSRPCLCQEDGADERGHCLLRVLLLSGSRRRGAEEHRVRGADGGRLCPPPGYPD